MEEAGVSSDVAYEGKPPSFTPVHVSSSSSDVGERVSGLRTRTPEPSSRSFATRCRDLLQRTVLLWAVYWSAGVRCLRYTLGDEDTDATQLPEWAQRVDIWYRKRGGRRVVWGVVGVLAVFALLVLLYMLLMGAYAVFVTMWYGDAMYSLGDTVHRFKAHQISIKQFDSPYDIDHLFRCKCKPIRVNGRLPTKRIPIRKRSTDPDGLVDAVELAPDEPEHYVLYENIFWVNAMLMERAHQLGHAEPWYMMPKMWNVSASPEDAAFLREVEEFNPCLITIRTRSGMLNMVHPRIVKSETGDEDERLISVGHVPVIFEPFIGDNHQSLVSRVRDRFTIRYYPYPHVKDRQVRELGPDMEMPEFRIWLQIALNALNNGFQRELDAHGPFEAVEARRAAASHAVPDPLEEDEADEVVWINGEATVADTDDDDYTETSVDVAGQSGTFVRRVVNGKPTYVSKAQADRIDADMVGEL